eukprot:CAMPEP_0185464628 /NCGR_PEP_ID=MMETSP1365-20130426/95826_1 /TAXON_ID=38817 /ORGANISM="Gephyrocapsa oceanica, Strain RCC1303" /LENGTH=403 /DNA_ID=CAMNT_0028071367 /DNA_START=79 /DNA_END=1287 /DNA_ORIENTATION=-
MADTFLVAKHTLLRGSYMRQLRVSPADNSVITTRPKDDTAVTSAWPADSIVAVESKSGLRFDVVLHPVCGVFPRRLHFAATSADTKPSILASLRAAAIPLNGGSSSERAAPVSRPANPATASPRSCAESSSGHWRVPGHECPSPPRDAPTSTPGAAGECTLAAAAAEAETDTAELGDGWAAAACRAEDGREAAKPFIKSKWCDTAYFLAQVHAASRAAAWAAEGGRVAAACGVEEDREAAEGRSVVATCRAEEDREAAEGGREAAARAAAPSCPSDAADGSLWMLPPSAASLSPTSSRHGQRLPPGGAMGSVTASPPRRSGSLCAPPTPWTLPTAPSTCDRATSPFFYDDDEQDAFFSACSSSYTSSASSSPAISEGRCPATQHARALAAIDATEAGEGAGEG